MEEIASILNPPENYKEIIEERKPWVDDKFARGTSVVKGIVGVASWRRASEIFDDKEKIYESFSAADIIKGGLNDAYLLAALSALAEFPGRVQKLFVTGEKNPAGCYVVKLYICGQYVNIAVDDYFPVTKEGTPAFAGSRGKELWAMLIEKAWAKMHGSYTTIEKGDPRESLSAVTGAPVEQYSHKERPLSEIWDLLKKAEGENFVVCTSAALESKGISNACPYTVVNVHEVAMKDEKLQLVQIGNVLADAEWDGDWNEKDPRWTPELRKELNHLSAEDRTFFMTIQDFYEIFSQTFVARVKDSYVYSSLLASGQKAYAAFRVRRPLKCCLSAYQITKRLGSTVVKDYSVERLKLELFKFDKKNLVGVKEMWNNEFGQAHMEVELEPGVYILKGSFDFSTSLPLIVFSSYGERRINFAQLKVKTQRQLTLEKALEALHTLSHAYTASGHKKNFAGAFKTCSGSHPLEWSSEPCKSEKQFECENCKETKDVIEGRWVCKQCLYNICDKCKPKRFGRIGKEARSAALAKCSKEHNIKFAALEDKRDIYLCDACGRAFQGVVPRWCCALCDNEFCHFCLDAPPNTNKELLKIEIETCPKHHKLEFVIEDAVRGIFDCYICSKWGDPHAGRWSCPECDISICTVCKPSEESKEGLISVRTMTLACNKGHILRFGCSEPGAGELFACRKCKTPIDEDNWRWTCDECEYNICSKCRPEPEGRRDLLCRKKHKLVFSVYPVGKVTYGRCDKCNKVFKLSAGRYCCFGCDYECCNNCVRILAESEDNVVVERSRRKPVRPPKPATDKAVEAERKEGNPRGQGRKCVIF